MQLKFLKVKPLFSVSYYDGPLRGLCEYEDQLLFYQCYEEIWFQFPETDPESLKVCQEYNDTECLDHHRVRIYALYKLPQELLDIILYNRELFKTYKQTNNFEFYKNNCKSLPKEFDTHDDFTKYASKYLVGYTTEDYWDDSDYYKKRFEKVN